MSQNDYHFAVLVGINKYPAIGNLTNCINDCSSVEAWLLDEAGGNLPKDNVRTVFVPDDEHPPELDRRDAAPKLHQVHEEIFSAIERAQGIYDANPDDWSKLRLYLYLSGHGFAPQAKEAALLMADASPDWPGLSLGTQNLVKFLEESQPFKEVVILADCCRERVAGSVAGTVPWGKSENNRGRVVTFLGLATGFGEVALENTGEDEEDASDDEESFVNPDELRSYFTQALLEGLKGDALPEGKTEITSIELENHLYERVRELTKGKKKIQVPDIDNDRAEPIVFRTLSPPASVDGQAQPSPEEKLFTLEFPETFVGSVRLLNGEGKVIDRFGAHNASEGSWRVPLSKGFYRLATGDGDSLTSVQNGIFQVTSREGSHAFKLTD